MKICPGKIHEYLGMTLDFTVDGEVKITMIPYVKEIVRQFKEHDKSTSTAATPAQDNYELDVRLKRVKRQMGSLKGTILQMSRN